MNVAPGFGPDWLHDKIAAGDTVIIDGAMGTELETRNVPMNAKAWSGGAMLTHSNEVRATHIDYITAGAEVIITNTFATGRQMLEPAGLAEHFDQINRIGVRVAKEAREEAANHPVAIAGSMCEWVALESEIAERSRLTAAYHEQAELLAREGVDLIVLEMCSHPVHSPLIVEAALATGLPVWLGVSCVRDPDTGRLVGFDPPHIDFNALIAGLASSGVVVINVMHSAIGDTADGIATVKQYWSGPMGVYPESGHFVMPHWQFVNIIDPHDLVAETRGWMNMGVQIIGGCCGLSIPHIEALKVAFG